MAQSKHQIQQLLAQAGSQPRHRFGQNFMIDQNLVRLIAESGQIGREDLVIEVGPGTGTLTEELVARSSHVVAVEIDRDLAALLQERLAGHAGLSLIQGDALSGKHQLNAQLLEAISSAKAQGRAVRLVANLPYNIASPLIIELLLAGVETLTFTVQKEVADRLRAAAGGEEYGPLTVMAQLLGDVEVLRTLPPQAFWPAPRIESALVRITRHDRLGARAGGFHDFLGALFSSRRKMLRKSLREAGFEAERVLGQVGVEPEARVEQIPPGKLVEMYQAACGV